MRSTRLRLVLAVVVVLVAVPAFAGIECKKCAAIDNGGGSIIMGCALPESGQWGTEGCDVECYGSGSNRTCFCSPGSWGCLYEVVQG
jgi:hypothetical protein